MTSHKHVASSQHCSTCGGAVYGYKCPACGKAMPDFDHDHWRNCAQGGKLKLNCAGCMQAEPNCTC